MMDSNDWACRIRKDRLIAVPVVSAGRTRFADHIKKEFPMNAVTMLRAAIALLTIGALHSVVVTIFHIISRQHPLNWLAMLLIAALVRVVLNLKYQWQKLLLPRGLLVGHAVRAVVSFTPVQVTAFRPSQLGVRMDSSSPSNPVDNW
jgi:hypothetical protein